MNRSYQITRLLSFALFLLSVSSMTAFAQTGGTITNSVTASGGTSSNGALTLTGTVGQSAVGARSANATFLITGGFLQSELPAPTSFVTISGRILTTDGRGIRNVRITLTETNGTVRTALTGSFGYYSFTDVPAGQFASLNLTAKNYNFSQQTTTLSVIENINDLDFTGLPN